jgi:hypothetical protein
LLRAFSLNQRQVASDCDLRSNITGAELHVEDQALADSQPYFVVESLRKTSRLNFDSIDSGGQQGD